MMVQARNLSKSYRRGGQVVPVLADINLDIDEGEFVALIAGIDKPSGGTLRVNGLDIGALGEAQLADWRARAVGFIFQFYNLLPVLTAFENVELPLLLTPLSRRERREHAQAALEMVGLSDRMRHYPSQLSGGQQQRVAIARAIITDPQILVADEPTGDLDRVSAADVLGLMEQLNAQMGKTVVMVTHDQRAAEAAHRLIHLDKGVLIEGGAAGIDAAGLRSS